VTSTRILPLPKLLRDLLVRSEWYCEEDNFSPMSLFDRKCHPPISYRARAGPGPNALKPRRRGLFLSTEWEANKAEPGRPVASGLRPLRALAASMDDRLSVYFSS